MNYARPLFREIAAVCGARKRCLANGNEFSAKHDATLTDIEKRLLPKGTTIDREASSDGKIVLNTSFVHLNENADYLGSTDHRVIVLPAFDSGGISLAIGGRNIRDCKEDIHEILYSTLVDVIDWDADQKEWFSVSVREASERYKAGIADGSIV